MQHKHQVSTKKQKHPAPDGSGETRSKHRMRKTLNTGYKGQHSSHHRKPKTTL